MEIVEAKRQKQNSTVEDDWNNNKQHNKIQIREIKMITKSYKLELEHISAKTK